MIRSAGRSLFLSIIVLVALAAPGARAACVPSWDELRSTAMPHGTKTAADLNGDGLTDVVSIMVTTISVSLMDAQTGSFAPPSSISAGNSLTGVAAFDATSDGHVDLVLADDGANAILVLPGNGDGTFGSAISSTVASARVTLVAADFNYDGKGDLAGFRTFSPLLVVWLGDGAGHFTQSATFAHNASAIATADFDGDGYLDLLANESTTAPLYLFRGNGTGALAAPVTIAHDRGASALAAADLDADNDVDIIAASPNLKTISVLPGFGNGTFGTTVHYDTRPPGGDGGVFMLATGDVTGDGRAEILTVLPTDSKILTLPNNGDGTFAAAQFTPTSFPSFTPTYVALGEMTGDAKKDLVVGTTDGFIAMAPNDCRDTAVVTIAATPLVSAGDTVTIKVTVAPEPNHAFPSGTVTIFEGDATLATGSVADLETGIELAGLAVGTHSLHAEYSGDSNYDAATSDAVDARVTSAVTTVSVLVDRTELPFDELLAIDVAMTEPDGSAVTGSAEIYINDVLRGLAPLSIDYLEPGNHAIRARFLGTAEHPRAISAPLTVTTVKAAVTLEVPRDGVSRLGNTQLRLNIMRNGDPRGGTILLYEGPTLLSAVPGSLVHVQLSLGRHVLTAKYEGSDWYLPAETPFVHTVLEDVPVAVDVASTGGQVRVAWISAGTYVAIERWSGGAWSTEASPVMGSSWTVPNPQPGVVYVYRVVAYDDQLAPIGTSAPDMAMLAQFQDDVLTPGTTRIRALHVTELVSAINAVRSAAKLAPVALANAGQGNFIRVQHFAQLRTALNEARAVLGAPPLTFDTTGTTVRALHVQQLRDAVR